jgi:cupin fold WbuC family metalloprotein
MFKSYGVKEFTSLIAEAKASTSGRSRICIHQLGSNGLQGMIICLLKDSKIGAHRHPVEKIEIYVVLEGTLGVRIFDEKNTESETILLNKDEVPIFKTENSLAHEPYSITEYCIYFEAYQGPFNKAEDVKYI